MSNISSKFIVERDNLANYAVLQQTNQKSEESELLPQWDISEHKKGAYMPGEIFVFLTENHLLAHDSKSVYLFDKGKSRYEKFSDQKWLYFVKENLTESTSPQISPKICRDVKAMVLSERSLHRMFSEWPKEHQELVGVSNGIFNATDRTVRPATPDDLISHFYDFNYLEGDVRLEQAPNFKNFLETSLEYTRDESSGKLLMEVLGYALSNSTKLRKLHIFYGASGAGKSLILNLLQKIIGWEYVSNVPLHELSERYNLGELESKQCNISTEISSKPLAGLSTVKALSSSERVHGEIKYQRANPFESRATLIFATNVMPEISHKEKSAADSAFFNRLNFVIFPVGIPENDFILDLDEKLYNERDVIFSLCLNAYSELMERNFQLTRCQASLDFLSKYRTEEFHFEDFASSRIKIEPGAKTYITDIASAFQLYCEDNGFQYKPDNREIRNYFAMHHPHDVEYKRVRIGKRAPLYGFLNVKLVTDNTTEEKRFFKPFKNDEFEVVEFLQDTSLFDGGEM